MAARYPAGPVASSSGRQDTGHKKEEAMTRLLLALVALGLLVGTGLAGGASSAPATASSDTWTDGGYTETQTDLSGRVLFTRSGDLAAIPKPTTAITNSPAPQAC